MRTLFLNDITDINDTPRAKDLLINYLKIQYEEEFVLPNNGTLIQILKEMINQGDLYKLIEAEFINSSSRLKREF